MATIIDTVMIYQKIVANCVISCYFLNVPETLHHEQEANSTRVRQLESGAREKSRNQIAQTRHQADYKQKRYVAKVKYLA